MPLAICFGMNIAGLIRRFCGRSWPIIYRAWMTPLPRSSGTTSRAT